VAQFLAGLAQAGAGMAERPVGDVHARPVLVDEYAAVGVLRQGQVDQVLGRRQVAEIAVCVVLPAPHLVLHEHHLRGERLQDDRVPAALQKPLGEVRGALGDLRIDRVVADVFELGVELELIAVLPELAAGHRHEVPGPLLAGRLPQRRVQFRGGGAGQAVAEVIDRDPIALGRAGDVLPAGRAGPQQHGQDGQRYEFACLHVLILRVAL
jgi:hypothetical protein